MANELHATHPGITKMKGLARSYVWWPKMDHDVEQRVLTCRVCQEVCPTNDATVRTVSAPGVDAVRSRDSDSVQLAYRAVNDSAFLRI